jgi:ribosomal protein S18 acetylase RimI-like enzyme
VTVQLCIRRVGPDEEMLFSRIAEDVFDEPVDPARLRAYLAAPGHHMLLAMIGDLVVGQVAAVVHRHPDKPTELYIDEVGVAPDFQRQGIGRMMVEAIFALGRELGCEEAWLGTEHDNVAARALYDRQGVKPEPFVMYLWEL